MTKDLRQRWEDRYVTSERPWDTGVTPPEVQAFWATRQPVGLALDLGCGTGTNVRFLAGYATRAIGVEHAYNALAIADQRLAAGPPVVGRIDFIQADAARLPFSALAADYILDIGCLHGIPPADRPLYAQGVVANLQAGGHYHLYAFDRVDAADRPEDAPAWRGLGPDEAERLFQPHLTVVDILHGRDGRSSSRWYLLRKN